MTAESCGRAPDAAPEAPWPSVGEPSHVTLGGTGVSVSRLALGTVNFGGRVEEPEAHRLLDHAAHRGINFLDTANIYGWRVHRGYTEEVIGRWLQADRGRRDRVVLATKVGNDMGGGPNDRGLSARHVIAACEASLRRLQTDCIDVYQMHGVDRRVGWDEIWQGLEHLRAQGKIRYVGSSNFAGWDIAAAQESAARRHGVGLASEQCVYNLTTRHAELEVIPAARAYGLSVYAWSPLHGGLLSGVLRKIASGSAVKSAQGRAAEMLAERRATVAEYEDFCDELGVSPAVLGLAWVLSRPGIAGAVIGPRTEAHVDEAIEACAMSLGTDELRRLDALFPAVGRGGPAPDAWLS